MRRKTFEGLNFVTLTVVGWLDVFTRRLYSDFIIENLAYCRENKGLFIHAYVLMPNHLHMVAWAEDNLSDILRDFKTYTSKELFKMIKENSEESRKDYMLKIFKQQGKQNELNVHHQFWQNDNYPVALYSHKITQQKVDYIHTNPVKAGFVDEVEKYYYSSANPNGPLVIDV